VRKIAISGYCFSVAKNQSIMICSVCHLAGTEALGWCRRYMAATTACFAFFARSSKAAGLISLSPRVAS